MNRGEHYPAGSNGEQFPEFVTIIRLHRPLPQQLVTARERAEYPVTRAMSNARHATPDCIEPIVLGQTELQL